MEQPFPLIMLFLIGPLHSLVLMKRVIQRKEDRYGKESADANLSLGIAAVAVCSDIDYCDLFLYRCKGIGQLDRLFAQPVPLLVTPEHIIPLMNALINTIAIAFIAATVSTLLGKCGCHRNL